MSLALRELRRCPRAFFVPTGILMLLAVLLLYPSAVLDGLLDGSTAAVRHAPADLIVFSRDANGVQMRSQVGSADRRRIERTPGVEQVAGFGAFAFTGTVEPGSEPLNIALLASDDALARIVPRAGEAVVDRSLRQRASVGVGDTLLIGPFRVPVEVVGFTGGVNLWLLPGVVVDWTTFQGAFGHEPSRSRPAGRHHQPVASQTLLVSVTSGADQGQVAAAIDEATGGETETMTKAGAVRAMPGVAEQESTFGYMRLVTLFVAVVVVGLFLSFMTLERTPLYSVLKAVGASSRQLFAGVIIQALSVTLVAVLGALVVTWGLTLIPLELPTTLRLDRVLETAAALAATAISGSALSLRRVVRVDPASAVG